MRVVLVEDLLWSVRSRRKLLPWRAEGAALAEKQERIQTLAGS
jgi:hypothetical protein